MREQKKISPEDEKEMQLTGEIETLFRCLGGERDEEKSKVIEADLRDKLERYRKFWRKEKGVKEEVERYYERLEEIRKAT